MTGIQWTGRVWNPTTGCDKVSPGCGLPRFDGDNPGGCYAMAMAKRLKGMGQEKYQNDGDHRTSGPGFGLALHPDVVNMPLRWRKPVMIFINSMSDLLHERVPPAFIARVLAVIAIAEWHTFQLLTKRHGRLRALLSSDSFVNAYIDAYEQLSGDLWRSSQKWADHLDSRDMPWPISNLWIGVSAEDQKWADIRIPALLDTPASVRFVSAEPLLGPVNLSPWLPRPFSPLEWADAGEPGPEDYPPMLDWVIAGGESGPGARRCEMAWLALLAGQCAASGTPYFLKQVGSVLGREMGAGSHGADWDAWPEDLRIRQFPGARQGAAA
jgi:protein gp37